MERRRRRRRTSCMASELLSFVLVEYQTYSQRVNTLD
jgi:hypothetical protein